MGEIEIPQIEFYEKRVWRLGAQTPTFTLSSQTSEKPEGITVTNIAQALKGDSILLGKQWPKNRP
jgi:hypothetical protein